jgi:hypothetical protein
VCAVISELLLQPALFPVLIHGQPFVTIFHPNDAYNAFDVTATDKVLTWLPKVSENPCSAETKAEPT